MELAALGLSILGSLTALLSWFESRKARKAAESSADSAQRSAQAASESARIEAARRHDELSPRLRTEWVELERQGNAWGSGIRIYNERTIEYTEVEAQLLPPPTGDRSAAEAIQSTATRHVGDESKSIPLGAIAAEGSTSIIVHPVFDEDGFPRGGAFRVQLSLKAGDGSSWRRVVDGEFPPTPRVY